MITTILYEIRKIVSRKILWITFPAMIILSFLLIKEAGPKYEASLYSKYNGLQWNENNFPEISKMIDEQTSEITIHQYTYMKPLEYYCSLKDRIENISYESWFQMRRGFVNSNYDELLLTDKEINYWEQKGNSTFTPTLEYTGCWEAILSSMHLITAMFIFITSLVLAPVFSDEHILRTDAITICTRYGRKRILLSKLISSSLFVIISGCILLGFVFAVSNIYYGSGGYNAPIQMFAEESMLTVSTGNLTIAVMGLMIISGIMNAVMIMLVSLVSRSSISALSLAFTGLLFTAVFNFTSGNRLINQITSYLPVLRCGKLTSVDERLVAGIEAVPFSYILYTALTVVFILLCWKIYKKYNVRSR